MQQTRTGSTDPSGLQTNKRPRSSEPSSDAKEQVTGSSPSVAVESQATMRRSPPSQDEIASRAYARYLVRGGQDGYDLDDWLAAEQELFSDESNPPLATR